VLSCGIPYRPPYSIRHSFAAWSPLAGIDSIRLVSLMGHANKKMVYEVYGHYLNGLEGDYWDIVNYFGKDFIDGKRKPLSSNRNLLGESLVKGIIVSSVTSSGMSKV
jgi:integrase